MPDDRREKFIALLRSHGVGLAYSFGSPKELASGCSREFARQFRREMLPRYGD